MILAVATLGLICGIASIPVGGAPGTALGVIAIVLGWITARLLITRRR